MLIAKIIPMRIRREKNCGVQVGNIVISTSGRDKGLYFIVIAVEEEFVYLADGNIRKIERPKKKKLKHIEVTAFHDENIANRVIKKNKITNQDIKKALRAILN